MHLNNLPLTGLSRVAMFVAITLPLACFKGDDGPPTGDGESESETTDDTEGTCPVATEGCPCTGGGGCDQGLECSEGTCIPIQAVCGNGQVEADEACDDGNDDDTDSCTSLCGPPTCDDGIVSGDETDVDCGMEACNVGCDFGQACLSVADCEFPLCGPAAEGGEGMVCEYPTSCANWLENNPGATDNTYVIDPDGAAGEIPEMDVFCHMSKDGGGWTLVFVSSDDDVDTWTWNDRAKMAGEITEVGSLASTNLDFMSLAYHQLPFTDLLFIHQPSNVWAHYAGVGDGLSSIGQTIDAMASPVCDYNLAGQGVALVGGTLTASGMLCDTDLYFNLGDHEISLDDCMDFGSGSNTASFGPVWSANKMDGCPFDDPAEFALGPHGPCGACPESFPATEFNYLGYANALSLNTGDLHVGENYMQMYVR
jgi:cysteine-rich repeat protein